MKTNLITRQTLAMRPLNGFIKVKTWMDVSCGFLYAILVTVSMLASFYSKLLIVLKKKVHFKLLNYDSVWVTTRLVRIHLPPACEDILLCRLRFQSEPRGWVKKPKLESEFIIKPVISSVNHQPEANSSPPFTSSSRFLSSKLEPLHLITTWNLSLPKTAKR